MANKQSDPIQILANNIVNTMSSVAARRSETASFDKSFYATILGVNRKFTDDVSVDDQTALIQKYGIPNSIEEGSNNFYTIKINGVYYCKQQNGDFNLYDSIMVYIPNGDWSRMYIDYGYRNANSSSGTDGTDIPSLVISPDMPGGEDNTTGDLWIVTNDTTVATFTNITSTNFTRMYEYKSYNDILQWQSVKCFVSKTTPASSGEIIVGVYWLEVDSSGNAVKLHICTAASGSSATWNEVYPDSEISYTPSLFITTKHPMKVGDYWLELDNENDKVIKTLYRYLLDNGQLKWVDEANSGAGSGGVGEFLNDEKNSERFNDYTSNTSNYQYEHIEGWHNTSENTGTYSWFSYSGINHLENGYNSIEDSTYIHVEGYNNSISPKTNGSRVQASSMTHVEGSSNIVQGANESHVQGDQNKLYGAYAFDLGGNDNTATSCSYGIVRGENNTVTSCDYSYVNGRSNTVSNLVSGTVAGQEHIVDRAFCSAIFGKGHVVNANGWYSLGAGHDGYNDARDGKEYYLFIGGGGGSGGDVGGKQNIFTVDNSGNVQAAGSITPGGADYAETYEWLDGNPDNEDRRGLFVTLDGKFIRKATDNDDYILGVVSATPSVCGDTYDLYWRGKYKTDIFGALEYDKNKKPIISDEYDPEQDYIPQSLRKEKSKVGTVGKLVVVDDGTCVVNKYCKPSNDGIGTFSEDKNNYRVIERLDDTHIRIVIK